MRKPVWLISLAIAVIVGLIVTLIVVSRAPVPVKEGTAPSVVTRSTGEEAQPLSSAPPQEPREAIPSGSSGRAARGSGVEGVTSGGVTVDPPSGR